MMEADRLYLGGQFAVAEKSTVRSKLLLRKQRLGSAQNQLLTTQLSPAGKVTGEGSRSVHKIQTRVMVPLRLLVEQYPDFVPDIRLRRCKNMITPKKLDVLERATTLYQSARFS